MIEPAFLVFLFFIIAFFYSMAGFGGGSSYLAVLALTAINFQEFKIIALACNIVVVLGSFVIYYKSNLIKWKKIWPILLLSVPFAFLGGRLELGQKTFFVLLGFVLLIAGVLMAVNVSKPLFNNKVKESTTFFGGIVGSCIGFLSGLAGIGGGVFLSPVLSLSRWDDEKVIAATASVFILFNSIAGVFGQYSTMSKSMNFSLLGILMLTVFAGGQLGVRLSLIKLPKSAIKRISGLLIFIVGFRILYQHLL